MKLFQSKSIRFYKYITGLFVRRFRTVKNIREILKDKEIERLIDWELHPFDAVTRYLEWGTNWSRGLNHAKSCNEESAYFKIYATGTPARLMLVRQSHNTYEVISEVEAPQDLIDASVIHFACKNRACGINDDLRSWLKREASKRA
jgi:hypothetical protein